MRRAFASVLVEVSRAVKEPLPEYTTKVSAKQIAAYIGHFAIQGYSLVNGKVIPLAGINPSF